MANKKHHNSKEEKVAQKRRTYRNQAKRYKNLIEINPNEDGSQSPNIQYWIEAKQRQIKKLK